MKHFSATLDSVAYTSVLCVWLLRWLQNHTSLMDSVCWRHVQTLDILVDGPQADLIREEATALRAESGLVPGHEGAQVASAAKQSE